MLPTHFVYKPFSQNEVFQVCLSVYVLFFCAAILLFLIRLGGCKLELYYDCWYRWELHSGFFLPVGLVHDIDYFPFQTFDWYLIARGVQFQIFHVNKFS